jgi:diguanylate cyclase (GGDEF)-like protein
MMAERGHVPTRKLRDRGSMSSVTSQINSQLESAQQALKCHAVAFIAPTRQLEVIRCSNALSLKVASEVQELILGVGDLLVDVARKQTHPIISNRVRETEGGPLLGRFVVAPIRDESGFAGIFLGYNAMTEAEFTPTASKLAGEIATKLSAAIVISHDLLTGLVTRAAFEKQVNLWRKSCPHTPAVLLYGDIDQLHVINELWGFGTGDRAIVLAAECMQASIQVQGSVLCRLSGDRFTAFVPGSVDSVGRPCAERVRESVAKMRLLTSAAVNAQSIPLSISLGVAQLPTDETSLDHVLAAAEIACKAAKDRGRNRVEIYQDSDISIIRRHDDILIIGQLRSALDEGRFRVFAQPIASLLRHEEVARYEMLVRLVDEDNKLVMPGHFMSAATRYQLLPQLDRCVIGAVLSKLKLAYSQPGFRPIKVALNISGPSIAEPGFVEWLEKAIDESSVPARLIGFELTETAAVGNLERAQALMARLGAKGCEFALDDFGTGLSSLSYFQVLNPSTIKIDGSFIRDILENPRSESLVRAITQLANSMGIVTVAEYVESPAICMRLIELGVQFGQGFALGKPMLLDKLLNTESYLARAS